MNETVKKSHGVLKFFLGWLTGVITVIAVVAIAAVILIQTYEPSLAISAEGILESFVSETASSTVGLRVEVDLRTITYEKSGSEYDVTFSGLANSTFPISFAATVSEESYGKLESNVNAGGEFSKNLSDNYGLKGIIYSAIVFTDSSTKGKNIGYKGLVYDWNMNADASSSSSL